jgi:3-methyladenine DNA glycosylase/8-oxoguanine DNA glycosylase
MARILAYTPESFEIRHLTRADRVLGGLIERIGPLEQELEDDWYASLAGAIVAQQLSDAAAATIWGRLVVALGGSVTQETVLAASEETLRGAGLSVGKTAYVRDLATHVASGALDLQHIADMPDERAIEQLTAVKGIGRWTAEMFLIFSLGRPDVLALDDGALRATVGWLYGYEGPATREQVAELGERWRPYRTAASLYLWRGLALRRQAERAGR